MELILDGSRYERILTRVSSIKSDINIFANFPAESRPTGREHDRYPVDLAFRGGFLAIR